jgi:hypothetical protein
MALTGALFALLVGATIFTLVVRAFGTDRWVTDLLGMGGDGGRALALVLLLLVLCAFVLDAFEMTFVVIPIVMPPLLMRVPDVTWVAVLTLLVLQTSFLIPPIGYAVLMVRNRLSRPMRTKRLVKALSPYLVAQLAVLIAVLAYPALVWRGPADETAPGQVIQPTTNDDTGVLFERPGTGRRRDAGRREVEIVREDPTMADRPRSCSRATGQRARARRRSRCTPNRARRG